MPTILLNERMNFKRLALLSPLLNELSLFLG